MTSQTFAQPNRSQQVIELLTVLSYRSTDLKAYLTEIAHGVSQLIASDWSIVTVCEGETSKVVASSLALPEEISYQLHGSVNESVVLSQKIVMLEDVRRYPTHPHPPAEFLSYLGIPLKTTHGEVLGTICSFNHRPRDFLSEEIRIVELFAERAATAIDNFRLYQQQQQFNQRLEQEVAHRTAELEAAQTQLVRREQLAAIGQFATMIVHELKNPMTTVLMGLEHFRKIATLPPDQIRAELALSEVKRLKRLLSEILLYAKPPLLSFVELDLNCFIAEVIHALQDLPEAAERYIQFTPHAEAIYVQVDRDKLQQALTNVIQNACEAVKAQAIISVSICTKANSIQIHICNQGAPISADCLSRLTEPFYSTKPSGTGLGLAIVKRIVEAHAGELSICSDPTMGTIVRIELPLRSK
jgi:signal transduction histidine kinase